VLLSALARLAWLSLSSLCGFTSFHRSVGPKPFVKSTGVRSIAARATPHAADL